MIPSCIHPLLTFCVGFLATRPATTAREQVLLDVIALQNEKLAILAKHMPQRPCLSWAERLHLHAFARKIPRDAYADLVFHLWKPATVLGWLQKWQRRQANNTAAQKPTGRPPLEQATVDAIVRLYEEGIGGVNLPRFTGQSFQRENADRISP